MPSFRSQPTSDLLRIVKFKRSVPMDIVSHHRDLQYPNTMLLNEEHPRLQFRVNPRPYSGVQIHYSYALAVNKEDYVVTISATQQGMDAKGEKQVVKFTAEEYNYTSRFFIANSVANIMHYVRSNNEEAILLKQGPDFGRKLCKQAFDHFISNPTKKPIDVFVIRALNLNFPNTAVLSAANPRLQFTINPIPKSGFKTQYSYTLRVKKTDSPMLVYVVNRTVQRINVDGSKDILTSDKYAFTQVDYETKYRFFIANDICNTMNSLGLEYPRATWLDLSPNHGRRLCVAAFEKSPLIVPANYSGGAAAAKTQKSVTIHGKSYKVYVRVKVRGRGGQHYEYMTVAQAEKYLRKKKK